MSWLLLMQTSCVTLWDVQDLRCVLVKQSFPKNGPGPAGRSRDILLWSQNIKQNFFNLFNICICCTPLSHMEEPKCLFCTDNIESNIKEHDSFCLFHWNQKKKNILLECQYLFMFINVINQVFNYTSCNSSNIYHLRNGYLVYVYLKSILNIHCYSSA